MLNTEKDTIPRGSLHVAELAEQTGVTPATIRYYARTGILRPSREPVNGYRCFSDADRHRVNFVRQAQALGLTLGDIKRVLETIDHGEMPCDQVQALVQDRLTGLQEKIAELEATEEHIQQALATWQDISDLTPALGELCPLIERARAVDTPLNGSECLESRHTHESRNGRAVS
jgi:MerR family transcriptional regulator, Zn(II)-responsive regulator of zntA